MQETSSDNLISNEFEAKHNLTGFFKLLLEIDMRVNPQLYSPNNEKGKTNENEN